MTTELTSFKIDNVEFFSIEGSYYQMSDKGLRRLSHNVYKYYLGIFWKNYL
jgi:hypothetical protein